MKKLQAVLLSCCLLFGSLASPAQAGLFSSKKTEKQVKKTPSQDTQKASAPSSQDATAQPAPQGPAETFASLSDPQFLAQLKKQLAEDLQQRLDGETYKIEDISVRYISKEHLEELQLNAAENRYFGYTRSELDTLFQGKKYIFTLGDDGKTRVEEFTLYDDTYDKMLKNVLIGTGVISVCAVVTIVTGGTGAPPMIVAVHAVFAKATIGAVSAGAMSAVVGGGLEGMVEGVRTKDWKKARKAAALGATEGFKWGAISGAVAGGSAKLIQIKEYTRKGKTLEQAVRLAGNPSLSDVPAALAHEVSWMKSVPAWLSQCAQAVSCSLQTVGGKKAFIQGISCATIVPVGMGLTNAQRLVQGATPFAPTGEEYDLYRMGKGKDALFMMLTETQYNSAEMAPLRQQWEHLSVAERNHLDLKVKPRFWQDLAKQMCGQ